MSPSRKKTTSTHFYIRMLNRKSNHGIKCFSFLPKAPEVVIPVNNGSNHNGDGVRMMKASSISEANYANGKVYPYSLLTTTDPDAVPSDVDPSRKEAYLSDQDFQTHLGMDRECFDALPQWKQISLKKAANLF